MHKLQTHHQVFSEARGGMLKTKAKRAGKGHKYVRYGDEQVFGHNVNISSNISYFDLDLTSFYWQKIDSGVVVDNFCMVSFGMNGSDQQKCQS
jgi:hypothetical protein